MFHPIPDHPGRLEKNLSCDDKSWDVADGPGYVKEKQEIQLVGPKKGLKRNQKGLEMGRKKVNR